jgi:aspartate carbamoyltransferase catalytic subunit
MPLSFSHLISTEQISRTDAELLLQTAASMEEELKQGVSDRLRGKVLASLFYEPSTRTRLSFETAMLRLGGQVVTADGIQFSSMYKGETIEDTIRMAGGYGDIIAMRHPEVGSAARAVTVSPVPFVNAGDGPGEHPTQALLDLYTIQKEFGRTQDLHIAMVGDLKFGRTVHSLSVLLALFPGIRVTLISPSELHMPEHIVSLLREKGVALDSGDSIEAGLHADVIYMTRVQKERFADVAEYERLKLRFILQADHLKGRKAIVMHPLPRVGEISTDIDTLPNAAYFRQAHNGVPMRMGIMALLLGAA